MVNFLEKRSDYLYKDGAGKPHYIAELICDTGSELTGRELAGIVCELGSVVYAAREGKLYALDSAGTWYDNDGNEVPAND